jgi:hypothetical protein
LVKHIEYSALVRLFPHADVRIKVLDSLSQDQVHLAHCRLVIRMVSASLRERSTLDTLIPGCTDAEFPVKLKKKTSNVWCWFEIN